MTPEQRLSEWLTEMGRGSQAKLAKWLGVPAPYVNRWKQEQINIQREYESKIEDFFGKPRGALKGEIVTNVRMVRCVGTSSCGSTDINHSQEIGKNCPYNGDFWSDSLYCVIANGDSMSPDIEDGDEVICDPNSEPESGDVVRYTIHGEDAIKVLYIDHDANIIQLIPYSTSGSFKIRTIRLDDDDAQDLKMDKVVAVNRLKFRNRASRLRLIGRA